MTKATDTTKNKSQKSIVLRAVLYSLAVAAAVFLLNLNNKANTWKSLLSGDPDLYSTPAKLGYEGKQRNKANKVSDKLPYPGYKNPYGKINGHLTD